MEDDERLQSILTLSLERRGHEVRKARFGAEARELLRLAMPSVLVIDINLPDETGWDVLRWLRDQPGAKPRVIVLSAARPTQNRVNDLMPFGVLTKPFPIDALTRLVEDEATAAAD